MLALGTEFPSLYLNSVGTSDVNGFSFSFPCQLSGDTTISYFFLFCAYNNSGSTKQIVIEATPSGGATQVLGTTGNLLNGKVGFIRFQLTPIDKEKMNVVKIEMSTDGKATWADIPVTSAQIDTTQTVSPANGKGSLDFRFKFNSAGLLKLNHYYFAYSKSNNSFNLLYFYR